MTTRLLTSPRLQPLALSVDRAPALIWLGAQTLALWPTWRWMAERMVDGSDDPLGLLAVAALATLVWAVRRQLRAAPRAPWLLAALVLTLLASALHALDAVPPLASSLVALVGWACGLLAFLPAARRVLVRRAVVRPFAPDMEAISRRTVPTQAHFDLESRPVAAAPVLGLAVLSLPLLSSLQFYAGYPLRVVTAEASSWLLAPWFTVLREGSALNVDGHLVIVDAPCSGVQMAWLGAFTACAVALAAGRRNATFLRRLPCVSALVLSGNVLRNAVLVALEASGHAAAPWLHEALGLAVLAAVCGAIAWIMARRERCVLNS